ncbi:2-keto-4-pentenoate hydratase/2-oxohepta-3-ene-1,7-dioic acid hydratase in catechol pathway [Thermocatellispora tengchongensis]|uniref:2-keto-4-pentenoate hydratase/2-oxohepta-3-ene-1,7-dioic acid hydratase in catechol pathway n=1 Tax=Thermocatellispora tengchongensis TaxID=1073253 RepID=A0A840NWV5_9ACTN|nr:fumarylacetoacetate hydrolase family protein [Thermocatellispora tengchongensis]MBB5130676.1 2-keto-4-pentenoate hydratase/2-oxohepta-3-ene-1,7-dioic acid hydratase in catechol pathway [Thermocatellispora tengchongensis]
MRIANLAGRLVLLADGGAVDVERASGGAFGPDPQAVYERWDEFAAWAAGADLGSAEPYEVADLGAPVPAPRQIFAIGLNYRDHATESGFAVPEHPVVFTKFVSSLTGPTGDIRLPEGNVDWEVELVAVIGRRAYRVDEAQGWDYVAGLTIGQDISDRVTQFVAPPPQFSMGKSFPGFGPMGPAVVTLDEFPDRDDIELGCDLNGESMQKGRTSDMIFSVPALVARLSATLPLLPGDVIFTGTPAGVGQGRTPATFLSVGDELVTYVKGIGEMRHRFVAP